MTMQKQLKYFFLLLFTAGCLCFLRPEPLLAADRDASITDCRLNSQGSKVTIKVKIKKKNSSYGKNLYLLALDAYTSETKAIKASPLASKKNKKGTLTFKVTYKSTMLYQKFALAYKTNGKYQIISNTCYITNPEVLASYRGSGPKTISKKGLQPEDLDEALELRTQHAVINWTADSLLTTNCANTLRYKYRGKTYYFNADMLAYNDAQVQAYNAAGAKVTIILLLPNRSNSQTNAMRYTSSSHAKYSSFKISNEKGCRTFEALMSYLAVRYGTKSNFVSGWILGNEVNNQNEWNYGGNKKLSAYIANYARAFRICYNAVKSVSKNSNVYISLDHNWNLDADLSGSRYFAARNTLDEFYRQINDQGKIVFHIAYHAYPQGLVNPIFWDDALATNSADSTLITFRNLNVLTNYVKKHFGKNYTIMLSEQSFNSTKGEAVQAAAYAYAYYMCEGNSMIESFIYGRHFDNPIEMEDGCYWGLSDNSRTKRILWHVFQNIDTADSFQFTNQLVKYTDLKSWNKISGFKKSKYKAMPKLSRKPFLGSVTMDDANSATLFWKKVSFVDGYEIYRNDQKIETIMNPSVLGYTDEGLTAGETYTYRIRSFKFIPGKEDANEKGALFSSYSNKLSLTATTGKAAFQTDACTVSGKNITLSWAKQAGASGYEVARSTAADGVYTIIADTSKTTFTDEDTVSGTTYYYKVRSYVQKNGSNYYGAYSDTFHLQARIQLEADILGNKLTLSWTAWPNAAKYQIYCSSDGGTSFSKMKNINNPETLTYSCADYSVDKETFPFDVGETYFFKVRASSESGDSNIAKVKITKELLEEISSDQKPIMNLVDEETEVTETEQLFPETDVTESPEALFSETEVTETSDADSSEANPPEPSETLETGFSKPEPTEEPETSDAAESALPKPEPTEEPETSESGLPESESIDSSETSEVDFWESESAESSETDFIGDNPTETSESDLPESESIESSETSEVDFLESESAESSEPETEDMDYENTEFPETDPLKTLKKGNAKL